MDNHQWRLSQAYTYALYISKHISITLIPYLLIFLLHVNLFLFHVLSLESPLFILFLYSYFEYFTYSYTYHVSSLCLFHLSVLCLLLHSLYYYGYHIIPYLSHLLCLFLVTCLYHILDIFHLISCIMFFASFLCFHVSYTFI